MSLPETCIKRPVFASVLAILLTLFGIVGYTHLSVNEFPDIEFPIVSISTTLPGATPEVIDETVTDLIEGEMNTIEGVKHIKSKSLEGYSSVVVQFNQSRNLEQAAQDCRDAMARLRRFLPNDIQEPAVEKLDIRAFPVMWIAVSSSLLSPTEISHLAEKEIKESLQKLKGVGSVVLAGEKKRAIRVWLDPSRLAAHHLTVEDVILSLKSKNIDLPSGRIEGLDREFAIKAQGEITSLEGFRNLVVAQQGALLVRLSDLAQVEEGVENDRSLARYSQEDASGLGVIKQPAANTIEVAREVKKELARLQKKLPDHVHLTVAFDSSEFIQESVDEVKETLWSSTLLVVLCIFLFLRSWRSTLIPTLAIPISIIATFAAMHFLGFSLNNFTLLALVLAIGVVVDDAIVMLENIYRHIEGGMPKLEAALLGAKEMRLPVIAASLALISVFLPIAFMQGQVGQFFFEFGITVAVAIAVSAFVALTLTPMLSSRLLKKEHPSFKPFIWLESLYTSLELSYKRALKRALGRKYLLLAGAFFITLAGLSLFAFVGKEFAPDEDRGSFVITIKAPEGSTLAYTNHYLKEVEACVRAHPAVEGFFAALALSGPDSPAVNKGLLFVQLTHNPKRPSVQQVMGDLREKLQTVVGIDAWPMTFNPFSQGGQSKPFTFMLANNDYQELREEITPFVQRLRALPGFLDVESDLEENRSQFSLHIDREKAEKLGVSLPTIATTLHYLLAGKEATKFKEGGERFPVMVQMAKELSRTPDVLHQLTLRSQTGEFVRLDAVASLTETVGPSTIQRQDRHKVVTISANLEGITLKEAIEKAEHLAKTTLSENFTPLLSGEAEEMVETFVSFFLTFIFSLVVIYLVLAAQFESFAYPITIMLALPMSFIGALGGLYLCGLSLNIYSLIGMIMLMGLVTKNSILLVDCANQLIREGHSPLEALCEAGRIRLRPILMTATSTILGIVPIAFGFGAGGSSRRALGVCVIGGMLSSTFLTLFVIPAFYLVFEQIGSKFRKRVKIRS